MYKPNNYDSTQGYRQFRALPPGGYVCQVKKIEEARAKSGAPMLNIWLDISEGEHARHYERDYRSDTRADKRWGCIVYQLVGDINGDCSRGLRTFCDAVEASNDGFSVEASWGDMFCDNYKGLLVGGLFRREQYINSKSEEKWATRCFAFRPASEVRAGVETPADKYLEKQAYDAPTADSFIDLDLDDSELPF